MKNIEQYLKKGNYINFNNKRIDRLSFSNLVDSCKRMLRLKLNASIRIFKVKKESESVPKGDSILSRKSDEQLLIFDYQSECVYRKFASDKQFNLLKEGYPTLAEFYKINKVRFLASNFTEEKLIDGKVLRFASNEKQMLVFDDILQRYNKVLANDFTQLPPRIDIQEFFIKASKSNYPKEMLDYLIVERERVEEFLQHCIWTWNHSDLTPDNIIYNEDNYFVIDLERCEIMPVFYDIINFIYTLVVMCNNREALNNYFQGKYDFILKKVLNKHSLDFCDRSAIVVTLMMLKAVLAWDKDRGSSKILEKRWKVIEEFIQ